MKRILITGISGFIGEELAQKAIKEGYEVAGLIRQSFRYNEAINALKGKVKLYEGTLTDYARMVNIITDFMPDYVAHLGAITPVSYSFEHPWEVTQTNYVGTINLAEALKAHCPNLKQMVFASCHDDETRLVTSDGFKSFSDITLNDEVYSLNTNTGEIEIRPIKKVIVQDYKGKLLGFRGKRHDLLVTPNHRMFLQTEKTGKLFFEEASETQQRKSFVNLPIPKWSDGVDEEEFVFPKSEKPKNARNEPSKIKTEDLFYLIGLFIADGSADITTTKTKVSFLRDDYVKQSRDEKGQFKTTENIPKIESSRTGCRIRFSVPEDDKARKRLIKTLKYCDYSFSEYPHEVYLSSYNLYHIFKECGNRAKNKHIPTWMLKYSKKYLQQLFDGILDGDGYRERCLTTISKQLLIDIIELGFKLGKYVSFAIYPEGKVWFEKDERYIYSQESYHVYFSKSVPSNHSKNNYYKEYNGKVWSLVIDNNHNYLVERNNKLVFSGNSMETYGHQPEMHKSFTPFNEDTPQMGACPYACAKIAAEGYMTYLNYAYKFPGTSLRQTNCYGRKYNDYFVVEAFITQMLQNKDEVNFGQPTPVRNFIYVDDLVDLYLALFNTDANINGKAFTIGPPNGITIGQLADLIAEKLDWHGKINWNTRELRDGEIYYLNSDNKKITEMTGWEPKVTLSEGLDKSIAHWKKKLE